MSWGSVIESTTLPITLILEQCQLPIVIGNVIVSISLQLQITKLPISALIDELLVGLLLKVLLLKLLLLLLLLLLLEGLVVGVGALARAEAHRLGIVSGGVRLLLLLCHAVIGGLAQRLVHHEHAAPLGLVVKGLCNN